MKSKLLIVAVAATLSSAAFAQTAPETKSDSIFNPIALPGYTWGTMMWPNSVVKGVEDSNFLFQGKVEQGADWFKFGDRKEFTVNTFVNATYSADSAGLPWNSYVKPAIGAKIRWDGDWGVAAAGVQYLYQRNWNVPNGSPDSGSGVQLFVEWYSNWNLKK